MVILDSFIVTSVVSGEITYTLISYGSYYAFCVEALNSHNIVSNISTSEENAKLLFDLIVRNECLPTHLNDVVFDFFN